MSGEALAESSTSGTVDFKLEVMVLPVSDVDRAKSFYKGLGWREDADFAFDDARVVQLTPPGSHASIQFGKGLTSAEPGSANGSLLAVYDIVAARNELIARGAEVSEVFHRFGPEEPGPGPDPERRSYASWATFSDPDGNTWRLQEIKTRLPGR
jgi:catechol 2,3-dioxygenase-like lactoylglutathione lyase family enzyme